MVKRVEVKLRRTHGCARRTYVELVSGWLPPATRRGEKGRQTKPNRAFQKRGK